MPSTIDATWPADGANVPKVTGRANFTAARNELAHGGFFLASGTGPVERTSQAKLRDLAVSAIDFGALNDDSGTTVDQWLTGGTYSRGAADLTALRTMTGITDLALTDTIDWAAITAANKFAIERPVYLPAGPGYRITRALTFDYGGLLGQAVAAGSPSFRTIIRKKTGSAASDLVVLAPTGANHHFFFKDLNLSGGTRCLYASNVSGGGTIEQHSVFENLYMSGATAEGFYFNELQAIMGRFVRLKAENNGGHGIRFSGQSILNGAQIEGGRSVNNTGHGWFFENTHDTGTIPGVVADGIIAEFNSGAGVNVTGYFLTLYSAYFEQNDDDFSGDPDLMLASTNTTPNKVHANVIAIQPYFATSNHPSNIVIGGTTGGPQQIVVIQPILPSDGVIDTTHLEVVLLGGKPNQFIVSGTRRAAMLCHPGIEMVGSKSVTTTLTDLTIPVAPTLPAGVNSVLARHSDGSVAQYLLARNGDGTVTATLVAGANFLTFGVTNGKIAANTSTGTATVSIHGH